MQTLKVVTFNIWNNQGPWPERLGLIRRELTALGPDLVGLQEVLQLDDAPPPGMHQAQAIADGLGYHVAFAPAWDIGGGLHFGNALLSRFPISKTASVALPCEPGEESRGLLYCLVDAPFGQVPLFVTHLSWKLSQSAMRQQQVALIVDKIQELHPSDAGPALPPILMGDFNAEPEADEIRFLRGYRAHLGRSVYFSDAWAVAGDGTPGYTFARDNPYAAGCHEPSRRLDYLFSRGPDARLRGEPLTARLCLQRPEGGIFPSDHYGLYVELSVEPRGR